MDYSRTGRYLSKILRHQPELIGITVSPKGGWANVQELIAGVQKTQPFSMEILEEIVRTDSKQRYSFNADKTLIRANQGHSIPVDLELPVVTPPAFLYHGTAQKFVRAIERDGLLSRGRNHVHLSPDVVTAAKVGRRHGKPIIFQVASGRMEQDGYLFYQSVNGVWLTERVPPQYLKR